MYEYFKAWLGILHMYKRVYLPFACLWGKPSEIPLVFCTIHGQQIEPLQSEVKWLGE